MTALLEQMETVLLQYLLQSDIIYKITCVTASMQ